MEAVGPAVVTGLQVGDEVYGYVRRDDVHAGTTAELVPAPERTVTRKPQGLSFEEAAALPLAGLTAYQALVQALQVQAGERVLIHAASGGVGLFAVQIAKSLGAYVIGTASPVNHDLVRSLGADEVLDYSAGPASEQLDRPVDAVLDLIGGDALADAPKQVDGGTRIASVVDAATVLELGGTLRLRAPRPRRPRRADATGRRRRAEGRGLEDLPARPGRRRPPGARAGHRGRRQDRRHPQLTAESARRLAETAESARRLRPAESARRLVRRRCYRPSTSATWGAIARNALPRCEIASFSSTDSSADVRPSSWPSATNSTS